MRQQNSGEESTKLKSDTLQGRNYNISIPNFGDSTQSRTIDWLLRNQKSCKFCILCGCNLVTSDAYVDTDSDNCYTRRHVPDNLTNYENLWITQV
jgi:hypothetical protein